jgi:hypothetical protein
MRRELESVGRQGSSNNYPREVIEWDRHANTYAILGPASEVRADHESREREDRLEHDTERLIDALGEGPWSKADAYTTAKNSFGLGEKKVDELIKKGDAKAADKMVQDTAVSVTGAVKNLNRAVDAAVQKQLAEDKRADALLVEAQVRTAVNVTTIVLKTGTDIGRLVATSGADLKAYKNIAQNIYDLAVIIRDEAKGEAAVRMDFLKTIGSYSTTKQRKVTELEQEAKKQRQPFKLQDPKVVKLVGAAVKPEAAKVEAARKKYQAKVTKMRQGLMKMGAEADKLEKAMKGASNLTRGVELGAKLMKLKGSVKTSYTRLTAAEKFAQDMAMLLTEAGIKMDDRTFSERLKQADVADWAKLGKELADAAKEFVEMFV